MALQTRSVNQVAGDVGTSVALGAYANGFKTTTASAYSHTDDSATPCDEGADSPLHILVPLVLIHAQSCSA
jgi:hypothetical protein